MESLILAHGDCDGVCAASIVLAARKDAKVVFTNPAELLSELRLIEAGNIIITDIALTPAHGDKIVSELMRLSSTGEIVYLDHHPLPPGLGLKDLPVKTVDGRGEACASELAYVYFKEILDPEISRVAVYGAIGDYSDNTPGINEILKNWDKRELYLEAGILIAALEGVKKRDFAFKRKLVEYLSENRLPSLDKSLVEIALREAEVDEEMRRVIKSIVKIHGRVAYVVNPHWSLGKAATYARAYGDTLVGVAAEEIGEKMDMSLRSVELKNLHGLVSRIACELKGIGGGHANAAGARIPKEFFSDFIKRLDEELSL
ncbi:MAG: DHHA1 domain-containing protein [Thermoproteota archaeon]